MIWDIIQLPFDELWERFAPLQRAGDLLATLGFVALLITNGVVAGNLGNSIDGHGDIVMLLAYNSFPWIICA